MSYTRMNFAPPSNIGEPIMMWLCGSCGAFVGNCEKHDTRHLRDTLYTEDLVGRAHEAEKLRQALADIRALHQPIEVGSPESRYTVCGECCYADDEDRLDGHRTTDCIDWHHHGDPYPICPTADVLDRAGV